MHRGHSLYLDWIRLIAALEVFAFHLRGMPATGITLSGWNALGHEAVVIFFVLSGFVIRHAAGTRDQTGRDFAISRLTRVYSVAIPALVLTYVFDRIGHSLDASLYEGLTPRGSPFVRLGIGAAMLNEAWVSVQMLSNTPYWSISYEFWYYVIFGAVFYLRGKTRWIAAIVAASIAGPKILLLFPLWMMGWYVYTERASARWPRWVVWLAFWQPIAVLYLYRHFDLMGSSADALESWMGHDAWRNGLSWSRFVLSDTFLGISVAFNLAAAKHLGPALERMLGRATRPIRWAAGSSFTLYLIHQPTILVTTAALIPFVPLEWRGLAVAVVALGIILAIATVTEGQRHRLKAVFERLFRPNGPPLRARKAA